MKKTGKEKLETLVRAFPGQKLGIDRIKKYTGLSIKSIRMYTSWNAYGKFQSNALRVSLLMGI